ncbi:MAG TPA: Ig-like domain-containing protein, partial [Acidimicrobiales bacterium]|nr:Ig-like domain-containing protein [Acidimicrobiales bacterium]
MGIRKGSAVAAAVALVTLWLGLAPQASATAGYTWTGGESTATGPGTWSSGSNWSGGTAPSGTVGTLTFPDLSSCDSLSSPPSTACYNATDDVAGLSASGLSFSGGPYNFAADTNNDSLTVGSGGITVNPSTSASFPSVENLSMPLSLSAAQTWALNGTTNGPVGLNTQGGISGGTGDTLGVTLAGGASLTLSGTNEVPLFSATGADSSDTGLAGGGTGPGAYANGSVNLAGDLDGINGDAVDLTDVGAFGAAALGDLQSKGSAVFVGNGTQTPGSLSTGAASFDSQSALGFSIDGPSSGASATAGTDNSELTATPNNSNASVDTGAVSLDGAELNIQNSYYDTSTQTQGCFTPNLGTVYTLVSASSISGSFSVPTPGIFYGTAPLANGGTVELAPCNGATNSPVALNVSYNTSSTPNTVTAAAVTATTTTLTSSSGGQANYGANLTYTATVAPNSGTGTPTGTVTFYAYPENLPGPTGQPTNPFGSPTTLCSATLSSGSANCPSTAAPAGDDDIVAVYSPDQASESTFGGSAGSTFEFVGYTTTTTVAATPTTAGAGQPVTYTATVDNTSSTSSSTPPTGYVDFTVGPAPLCEAALFPTGTPNQSQALCTSTAAPAGSPTIQALYQPDQGPFQPSQGSATLDATGASSTVGITTSAGTGSVTGGASVTYTATVSGGSGTATGTVAVDVGNPGQMVPVCTITLASGTGTCSASDAPSDPPGQSSEPVYAVYSGDSTYAGSQGQTTLTVSGSSVLVAAGTNPTSTPFGQSVTYEASVQPINVGGTGVTVPTGTVTFSAGGTTLCTGTLAQQPNFSDAVTTCTATNAPSGEDTVTAVYSGGSPYGGAADFASLNVTANPTTTTLSASPSPATYGQLIGYTATISSSAGTPNAGTVSFSAGQTVLCAARPVSSGQATCDTSATPAGTSETITAVYSGSPAEGFAGSQGTTTVTVAQASSSTAVSVSPTSATYGQSVTYSATVTGTSGGATPTGSVAFSVGSTALCTAILTGGSGSCASKAAPAGTDTVTGTYSGDPNYATSSGNASLVVKASSSTSVSVSPTSATYGQSVTYSATVTGTSGGATPTRSVAFSVGSTALCTAT